MNRFTARNHNFSEKYSIQALYPSQRWHHAALSVSTREIMTCEGVSLPDSSESLNLGFSNLRSAMRITLPETGRGLNDDGELCSMKTIEKEVTKFSHRLSKDKNRMKDKAYQKLIGQINKYWDMLFCDPIVVETKAGKIIIQPQRTNNLLYVKITKCKVTCIKSLF